MRQNALLRSGKGLGTPGAARKKALRSPWSQPAAGREREDHFAVRNGVRCAGVHLIIDLHGAEGLNDIDLIEPTLRRCVDAARATLLHIHLHHFQPNGVSGVAVLAESHISIHTWPDAGYAALDVFMCGKANPDACIPVLREAFKAEARRGQRDLARAGRLISGIVRGRTTEGAGPALSFASVVRRPRTMADKRWIPETLFDELGFRMTYRSSGCSTRCRPSTSISSCSSTSSSARC